VPNASDGVVNRAVDGADPLRVAGAVAGPPVLAEALVALADLTGGAASAVRIAGWAMAVVLTFALVVRPLLAHLAAARLEADDLSAELGRIRSEMAFRSRCERALAQTESEPATIRTALRAAAELRPDADTTLLLALPGEAKVGWTMRVIDGEIRAARPLPHPSGCAALADNSTVSTDSASLDACVHFADPDMAVSATCVPLRVGEQVLGVVSVMTAPGDGLDARTRNLLEWVVERTGARLLGQRRLRGRSTAADSGRVGGFPGPDSLRRHLASDLESLMPFCLAMVDVREGTRDGVRADVDGPGSAGNGHDPEVGLADQLRLTLRPEDVVCHVGRGRFGVILANCAAPQASAALDRTREALVLAAVAEGEAPVTFSAGIVESHRAETVDDLLQQARAATSIAQHDGGNRVMIASD